LTKLTKKKSITLSTQDYKHYDLLLPQNIREYTGAYFTPEIWVEKSQDYLAQTFGNN
jgi:hypothetical protein